MFISGAGKKDGCGVFWSREVFERVSLDECQLESKHIPTQSISSWVTTEPILVEMNDLAYHTSASKTDKVRLLRHNVGILVALRHKGVKRSLVERFFLSTLSAVSF